MLLLADAQGSLWSYSVFQWERLMATCRHHVSHMLDVLTFSSPLFTWHQINTWGAFRIWIWHLLLCPHVWVLCQAATQREKHHPPFLTEIQAELCAKTYPPKDSKRSEENGKKIHSNLFSGVKMSKRSEIAQLRPGDFWFLTNLSQPIRNLPNSLVTCHLKKWDFSGNEVPPTKHQSWGTQHQRKTTEKIIKSTS